MAQGQSSTPVHTSQQLKGHGLNQGETGEARRKVRRRAERDRAAIGMADHMGGGWSANRSRLSRRAWLATGRRKAGGAACCGLRPALARSKRSWRRCATPTCGRCGHRAVRQRWSCTAAATGPCALKQVATWPPPSLGLNSSNSPATIIGFGQTTNAPSWKRYAPVRARRSKAEAGRLAAFAIHHRRSHSCPRSRHPGRPSGFGAHPDQPPRRLGFIARMPGKCTTSRRGVVNPRGRTRA